MNASVIVITLFSWEDSILPKPTRKKWSDDTKTEKSNDDNTERIDKPTKEWAPWWTPRCIVGLILVSVTLMPISSDDPSKSASLSSKTKVSSITSPSAVRTLRISTAVTCSLRSDATSGVVSSSSHATARYCRINYRNLTVTGEGTFLPLLQEYHLQQRQHQNRYPTPCDANDVVVWTMKRVQMLSFRTKNEIGAVKHTKLFRVRVYPH